MNRFFKNIYVINLSERKDRLESVTKQMDKYDLSFTRFEATVPDENLVFVENDVLHGWNKYAAALVDSTIRLIEDAKAKKLDQIMICEDDVVFTDDLATKVERLQIDPYRWDMIHFGVISSIPNRGYNKHLVILKKALCCHCYVVHSRIYDDYLHFLKKMDKPIDWVTRDNFQPFGRCFAPRETLAFQKPDYSNIKQSDVNYYMI